MAISKADDGAVLIVDDDEDIREILTELLLAEGYEVATSANGREALEYLRSHVPPAVVVLDIMMPVMDGWAFLAERAADASLSSIPVIIASANLDLIQRSELQLYDRLPKPFDTSRLLKIVAKWVRGAPSVTE